MSKFFLLVFILGLLFVIYKVFFTNWVDLLIEKFNLKQKAKDLKEEEKDFNARQKDYVSYLDELVSTSTKAKKKIYKDKL